MIPPGEEELLADMFGRGAALAGCILTSAEVAYTVVTVKYACAGEEVVFELSHPSKAPTTAIQTAQFAFTARRGSPPRSLIDALVSRIRSQEEAFEWEWPASKNAAESDDAPED